MIFMLILGSDIADGEQVTLSSDDRKQGTYIIGVNGTGKTVLLLNIALSDIQ
jgi:ABC-type cobalamin/Fe3+-siderophores transport system ATPase subunit